MAEQEHTDGGVEVHMTDEEDEEPESDAASVHMLSDCKEGTSSSSYLKVSCLS